MSEKKSYSFRRVVWERFKKQKSGLSSFYVILFFFAMALLAPILATHHPLSIKIGDERLYPAFSTLFDDNRIDSLQVDNELVVLNYNTIDWRKIESSSVIWAPIAYGPQFIDRYNRDYRAPSDYQRYRAPSGKIEEIPLGLRHYLGTDRIGRDVAAGIIHGSRISLLVGIAAILIAALIGIPAGAAAGYFGNDGFKVSRGKFWSIAFSILMGLFIGFVSRSAILVEAFEDGILSGILAIVVNIFILLLCVGIGYAFGKILELIKFFKTKVGVPIDAIVSRTIEILNSLPTLILIISIAAMLNERSLTVLVLIIGFTSWTGIARFMRAEFLRIKELEYIQTAKVLGYSNRRIIFKHALPNGMAPIYTTMAFGVASAILTESGLSFLGIGVPDDIVTWGNLLSMGREEFEASWLVIYPGLAIFITVTAYNLIGEALRDALDPRTKD